MVKRAQLKSLGDVDIRLVRVFVAVTESGGLAAAEPELNIGRSTISKHIADLEMRMGLKLCNRGPAGFSLTGEGERVLASARILLSSIDNFQSAVDNIHTNLAGTLRLGLFDQSTTNPNAHLHEAIHHFDKIAPNVSLEISIEPPNNIEGRVIDGTMDIGIVPIHRQSTSLSYVALYEEWMTLYCGAGHVLFDSAEREKPDLTLAEHKYAGFGFNSPNMKAGQTLGMRRAARVQDEEALSLLIQSGSYLGFLADHVAETFLSKGKVRPVAPDQTKYVSTFAAISRKQPKPDRKTQTFLTCLRDAHSA